MMGKMSELAAELSELKHCGEVLISLSESIMALTSGKDTPQPMDKPSAKRNPIALQHRSLSKTSEPSAPKNPVPASQQR